MIATDLVYEALRAQLASHQPERGGALYGPRDLRVVTHFEYDVQGLTSACSYVPSGALIANVQRIERETGLHFKGIAHSHPDGIHEPSAGDHATVQSFFRLNPHVSEMALPIVQQRQPGDARPFLYWYRAERRAPPPGSASARRSRRATPGETGPAATPDVAVLDESLHVLPLAAHVDELLRHLAQEGLALRRGDRVQPLRIEHATFLGLVASDGLGREFMYFVSIDYPVQPPLVLVHTQGRTETLPVHWPRLEPGPPPLARIADDLLARWREPAAAFSVEALSRRFAPQFFLPD